MKMYKTSYGLQIEEREITRKTEKCVFYLTIRGKEQKELIQTVYHLWHETKLDAANYLLEKAEKEVERCQCRLKDAINIMVKASEIKTQIESE